MSIDAISWVWNHSQAKGIDRLVLICLADYAGKDGGDAFPAVATIAERCGVTRRTVQRSLRTLEESGEIVIPEAPEVKNPKAGGRSKPTLYRLPMLIKQRQPDAECTPDPDTKGRQADAASELRPLVERASTTTRKGVNGARNSVAVTPEPPEPLGTNHHHPQPPPASEPADPGGGGFTCRLEAAARILAEAEADEEPNIRRRVPWVNRVTLRLLGEYESAWRDLLAIDASLTAEEMAAWVLNQHPTPDVPTGAPRPVACSDPGCPRCGGEGVVWDHTGDTVLSHCWAEESPPATNGTPLALEPFGATP